ncbi:hypothetical protein [Edaphobacter modestus]|uniref:hypothetical protein n=1 Tax=Edaphobacter modestus TaxID=388466 RepID=UPI001A9224D4|nr:hypothetical protein [Edaphobacter modestus]
MLVSPHTARGSLPDILSEIPRWTTERTLHAVNCRSVAAIEHDTKQIENQIDDVFRDLRL